jgi:hypothetical protein
MFFHIGVYFLVFKHIKKYLKRDYLELLLKAEELNFTVLEYKNEQRNATYKILLNDLMLVDYNLVEISSILTFNDRITSRNKDNYETCSLVFYASEEAYRLDTPSGTVKTSKDDNFKPHVKIYYPE